VVEVDVGGEEKTLLPLVIGWAVGKRVKWWAAHAVVAKNSGVVGTVGSAQRLGGGGDQARSEWRLDAGPWVGNMHLAVFHVASGRFGWWPGKMSWTTLFMWARHGLKIQIDFQLIKLTKFETSTSATPNIFKLGIVVDKLKRNIFPFGKMFKFSIEFELKIQETKQS
jgi:hypothetical protein